MFGQRRAAAHQFSTSRHPCSMTFEHILMFPAIDRTYPLYSARSRSLRPNSPKIVGM
jgi:hypothetical protein